MNIETRETAWSSLIRALGGIWAGLHHLLWPDRCLHCRCLLSEQDDRLCPICWEDVLSCAAGDYCPNCARDVSIYAVIDGQCPHCAGQANALDGMVRCGVYDRRFREMILRYKKDATELLSILVPLANSAFAGSPFHDRIDLLVPVPLHWTRRLRRGYNQAALITRRLSHYKARVSRSLVRIRATRPQPAMMTPTQRLRNVKGAFAVRKPVEINGRTVCLVDDIKTTGATLNECARTLKQAGAWRVYALVLAVAGQKGG